MAGIRVDVDVNEAAVQALFNPGGPVFHEVERTVARGVALSKLKCPVDEGRLRSSISGSTQRIGEVIRGSWGTPLEYGLYRHEGTGIYGPRRRPIRARPGHVMVFPVKKVRFGPLKKGGRRGRQVVFARQVRGIPGSPFLVDALHEVLPGAVYRRHRLT